MEQAFVAALLDWYRASRRALPWRETADPYRIWVSEVMLQQTRVEAVVPYFMRFINRFPDLQSLAEAPPEEVVKLWEGLGYYSRARHLHGAVREVQERYGGRVPDTYEAFLGLPGVGQYTAGAVLSIAYGKPFPAVDGNVLRVFARLNQVTEDVGLTATRQRIAKRIADIIPPDAAGDFNQALMELGARICLPRAPHCDACPVHCSCRALQTGRQEQFPVKTKKRRPQEERLVAFLLQHGNRICVRQRPAKGLLAGLWELPNTKWDECHDVLTDEAEHDAQLRSTLTHMGLPTVGRIHFIGDYTHVFTHRRWSMQLFLARADTMDCAPACRFVSVRERELLTFGQIFNKMIADNERFLVEGVDDGAVSGNSHR